MVGFIVSAILIIGGVIMYLFPSKNSNWVSYKVINEEPRYMEGITENWWI